MNSSNYNGGEGEAKCKTDMQVACPKPHCANLHVSQSVMHISPAFSTEPK